MASASNPALARGTIIRDSYEVMSFLGAGAYGEVYRVRHRFLGEQALKLLRAGPDAASHEELLEEARLLATLSHPHVVRVFEADIYESQGEQRPFFTMEHVRQGALASLMSRRVRLEITEALYAARQILLGLDAAHSLEPPVLHRDVTPGNVLVASSDPITLKLSDFGLAAHAHPQTGLLRAAGTIRYQPPEAAWGYASEAADVYAVALILYEMLTGMPAFPVGGGTVPVPGGTRALREPREREPHAPSRFRPGISAAIDELVVQALAPRLRDRFGSAREFASSLQAVVDEPHDLTARTG